MSQLTLPGCEPSTMTCLSLWQPWASLVACGIKAEETRGWPAPHWLIGQRIAIHAAKTTKGMRLAVIDDELWAACLAQLRWGDDGSLPMGAIVATSIVAECKPTDSVEPNIYGDFRPGRFAWRLTSTIVVDPPIPTTGRQGLFHVPRINT